MEVEFYRHDLGEAELASVAGALQSLFLTTGPLTARFEAEFARLVEAPHCVGTTSGTAALHLALLGLGLGPGDEVIVPAMTFLATATPVWWIGAEVVLADVEPDTGLIDVEDVARKITPRTRAVIPVHLYGAMADMRRLAELCRPRGIKLIEDSAHCVAGSRDGAGPGRLGEAACFSFYATKSLTSGEGGAVTTSDAQLADRLRRLRLHGLSKPASARHGGSYEHWDMLGLGYKSNMFDVQAALLLPQLGRLEPRVAALEAIAVQYRARLAGTEGIELPRVPPGTRSGHHLFTVWVPGARRDSILRRLGERGIGVGVHYRALHTLAYFRQRLALPPDSLPQALRIGEQTISLPFYPSLTAEETAYVARSLREALAGA